MKHRKIGQKIIITILSLSLLLSFVTQIQADGNTQVRVGPENRSVTIEDSFYIYVNVTADGDNPCSGWELENFTFSVGVINITTVTEGTYLSSVGTTAFSKGTIYNTSGYIDGIYCFTLMGQSTTSNGVACRMTGLAYGVGVSPINITPDLSYSGDPLVITSYDGNVTVHPKYITGSTATTESHNNINLSWTTPFGAGVDACVVFANSTGSAAGRESGDEIYNGTASYYNHTGLTPDQEWNYSFWGWNETESLFSLLFQQDSNTTDSEPTGGTWLLLGDPTPANGTTSIPYTTSYTVSIPIVAGYQTNVNNEAVTKGIAGGTDELDHEYIHNVTAVRQGATTYLEVDDYLVDEYDGTISWSPGGSEPSPGSTYYVNYTYIYNTASSFEYWINTTSNDKHESSVSSGTKSLLMTGLTGGQEWWNVTAVFEGNYTYGNFTFSINQKPGGGGGGGDWEEDPENAAPSVSVSTALSVNVADADDDEINISFYWSNGTLIDNDTVSGSGIASVNPSTLSYNTEYFWYVNATDGIDWTRGPISGYWSFNTSTLGIDLTKEWALNPENNTIRSWINVTNTGETNFTNVDIWDLESSGLYLMTYNHSGDFHGNGHWTWTIPYLNASGYENHWYNITMLHRLETIPAYMPENGDIFSNRANVSHLGLTDSATVSGYEISFIASKDANRTMMNDTYLDVTWWVNISNTGDFNLTNVTVNETYFPYTNYSSSNLAPEDGTDNETFIIPYIKPGEDYSLIINITTTPYSITNGTQVFNNITIRSDQILEEEVSEYLSYGGYTTQIRVIYDTSLTDVSVTGDMVFNIISVILVISAVLLIVGLLFKFGYLGKGEQ